MPVKTYESYDWKFILNEYNKLANNLDDLRINSHSTQKFLYLVIAWILFYYFLVILLLI